jgi:undecaprenyl-phosphate 4-deoxy-4-formamido-L-arabinose transferase
MVEDIKLISVVIPVYNEAENLPILKNRLVMALDAISIPYEIIFVDDGSSDNSLDILTKYVKEDNHLRVIEFNKNYGQHAAVFAGLNHAGGDVVITMDADLQNPPEEIHKLIEKIKEGYEVVGSFRKGRRDSLFRKIVSRVINLVVSRTLNVSVKDYGCMLRAYRRSVVDAICKCGEISTFIPVLADTFAKKVIEIPVAHEERKLGRSKYSLARLVNLQFDLMTGFGNFPIKVINVFGFLIAFISITFAIVLIALRLLLGPEWAVSGVFTIFAVLFFFVGLQFIAIGIIGEYVARIYMEVRHRPRYIVRKVYQKDSMQ